MAHLESCKGCKKVFKKALERKFGEIIHQWRSGWPCQIEDVLALSVMNKSVSQTIIKIFKDLQKHRGQNKLVRAKKLSPCDYYVKSLNCLIEIDESQHFTAPRRITLHLYPKRFHSGFDIKEWIYRCKDLDRHDNDIPYRDEQRAWFDTIRDLLPPLFGMAPTIRIFAKDLAKYEENYINISKLIRSRLCPN